MPLEQWNAMIESAEKEVAKEEPKKKTSNYIMIAETGDKQIKVKDRIVADEQNQTHTYKTKNRITNHIGKK